MNVVRTLLRTTFFYGILYGAMSFFAAQGDTALRS